LKAGKVVIFGRKMQKKEEFVYVLYLNVGIDCLPMFVSSK